MQSERIRTVSLAILAIIVSIATLRVARDFTVPTVMAGLLALALAPAATRIERIGLPRSLVAALLVIGSVGCLGATVYSLLPTAEAWNARVPEIARQIERMARDVSDEVAAKTGGQKKNADQAPPADAPAPKPREDPAPADSQDSEANDGGLVESGRRLLTDAAFSAPTVVVGLIYATFLAYFLLSERGAVVRSSMACIRSHSRRLAVGRALRDVRTQVATYLLAITIINILLGIAAGVLFYVLGIPNPAVWGVATAMLNFAPYLGPMIMNVIIFCVGLVTFPTVQDAIVPVVALAALNLLEGNIITPHVVGRQARIGPLAVFVAVSFGAWLWGPAGALLATPTMIVFRVLSRRLRS